jgi:hypothetical protein
VSPGVADTGRVRRPSPTPPHPGASYVKPGPLPPLCPTRGRDSPITGWLKEELRLDTETSSPIHPPRDTSTWRPEARQAPEEESLLSLLHPTVSTQFHARVPFLKQQVNTRKGGYRKVQGRA